MKKAVIFDLSDVYLRGILGVEIKISELTGLKVTNKDLYNNIAFEPLKAKFLKMNIGS